MASPGPPGNTASLQRMEPCLCHQGGPLSIHTYNFALSKQIILQSELLRVTQPHYPQLR